MSDNYEDMTVAELKALLKEAGLRVSGKKSELIERLTEAQDAPEESEVAEQAVEEVVETTDDSADDAEEDDWDDDDWDDEEEEGLDAPAEDLHRRLLAELVDQGHRVGRRPFLDLLKIDKEISERPTNGLASSEPPDGVGMWFFNG